MSNVKLVVLTKSDFVEKYFAEIFKDCKNVLVADLRDKSIEDINRFVYKNYGLANEILKLLILIIKPDLNRKHLLVPAYTICKFSELKKKEIKQIRSFLKNVSTRTCILNNSDRFFYDVYVLWHYSRNLPVKKIKTDFLYNLVKNKKNPWSNGPMSDYDKSAIKNADLRYPILVTSKYKIIDGLHRLFKANNQNDENINVRIVPDSLLEKMKIPIADLRLYKNRFIKN